MTVLVLVCALIFKTLAETMVTRTFTLSSVDGDFSNNLYTSGSFKSSSLVLCGTMCSQNKLCKSLFFNNQSQECIIEKNVLTPIASGNVLPWIYFIITRVPRECEVGWIEFDYSCYYFSPDSGSWTYGKTQCESLNSKYVQITSLEEDNFVRDKVRDRGITDFSRRDYWIGGTDVVTENVFIWEGHGEVFTYTNWGPSNPDNKNNNQHCIILFQPSDYKWHDTECTNTNSYICEK